MALELVEIVEFFWVLLFAGFFRGMECRLMISILLLKNFRVSEHNATTVKNRFNE